MLNFRKKYNAKIDTNNILTEDILLTSPSAAAKFVGGSSLNGNVMWETKDGKILKQLDIEE